MLYNVVLVSAVQRSESAMHARSVVTDSATPWPVARQAPLSLGFPRQEWVTISFSMFFFFFFLMLTIYLLIRTVFFPSSVGVMMICCSLCICLPELCILSEVYVNISMSFWCMIVCLKEVQRLRSHASTVQGVGSISGQGISDAAGMHA